MSHESSDPPPRRPTPGQYGLHESLATQRDDEPTSRTRALKERMSKEDWEIVERLTVRRNTSVPPPPKGGFNWWSLIVPLIVAVAGSVGGSFLGVLRSDVLSAEKFAEVERTQAAFDRRLDRFDTDLRQQRNDHSSSQAGEAKLSSQLEGIATRLDRIERQLDSQHAARLR